MTLPLEATAPNRLLPELRELFYDGQGDATELNLLLDGGADPFVTWRNRVIGHGVFKQERAWYAAETLRWLPVLHNLYMALRSEGDSARGVEGGEGCQHRPVQRLRLVLKHCRCASFPVVMQ